MRRIAQNDEEAFRELYEGTSRRTYNYLLRLMRDPNKANEVMIDTYTEVWKSAGTFKGQSPASTWIIGIARHLAMKEFKRCRATNCNIETLSKGCPEDFSAIDLLIKKDLIRRSMEKLSSIHKEILDLVFFRDMTYKEVSKALAIPVNTVKTRVFYAKERLRRILQNMEISDYEF